MKTNRSGQGIFHDNSGNILVITACSMFILIGFAALVIDGGYLFSEKDRFRNALESGALAGARYLSESAGVCKKYATNIAKANGIPDTATLVAEIGYYDVSSETFEKDTDDSTPVNDVTGIANNAVHMYAENDTPTSFARILSSANDPVKISAEAVAYGVRPTLVAYGSDGISIKANTSNQKFYNKYKDCVLVSAGPVKFYGNETFDNTCVETGDTVSNPSNVTIISPGTAPAEPEIDWDGLHDQAQANGTVYQCDSSWPTQWTADSCSPPNYYKRMVHSTWQGKTNNYFFLPANGDHEGRTYYFNFENAGNDPILRIWNDANAGSWNTGSADLTPLNRTVYNFTIAARNAGFSTYPIPPNGPYNQATIIGDYPGHGNEGLVFIYCDHVKGSQGLWYTRYGGTELVSEPAGVIMKMPGNFEMAILGCNGDFYLRVHAKSINIYPVAWGSSALTTDVNFMGDFGKMERIRIGRLN